MVASRPTPSAFSRSHGDCNCVAAIFDKSNQKPPAIPGIGAGKLIQWWTEDGQALLAAASAPCEGQIYRVEVESGKRTLEWNCGQGGLKLAPEIALRRTKQNLHL